MLKELLQNILFNWIQIIYKTKKTKTMMTETGFIPSHGNYTELLSYKKSLIVYSGTVLFCNRFLNKRDRTVDQMVQAERSGKQNIIEGSMASSAPTLWFVW